jgi:hypothetical protein
LPPLPLPGAALASFPLPPPHAAPRVAGSAGGSGRGAGVHEAEPQLPSDVNVEEAR